MNEITVFGILMMISIMGSSLYSVSQADIDIHDCSEINMTEWACESSNLREQQQLKYRWLSGAAIGFVLGIPIAGLLALFYSVEIRENNAEVGSEDV